MLRPFFPTLVSLIVGFTFFLSAESKIKSDETVVFFPSWGGQADDGAWRLEIRGWIFESERRPGAATLFRKVAGIKDAELTDAERPLYISRARLFLIDSEKGKPISVRIGGKTHSLGRSSDHGQFSGHVTLAAAEAQALQTNAAISFQAVLRTGDPRVFSGVVHLLPATGCSIISDIDDTIKISQVRQRDELLRNTFCRKYEAVSGLAELYRFWATNAGAAFHYVSASPVQLAPPLSEFLQENHFPPGTMNLRVFDGKEEVLRHFSGEPSHYKSQILESLVKQFPQRRFVLVGDSGERDPEIYGALARQFPAQIRRIFIRQVTDEAEERYQKAFQGIPAAQWQVFADQSQISRTLKLISDVSAERE